MYCDRRGPENRGCLCVCLSVCLCVRASLAKLLGRFQPNFHQMVPHWSSGVRLCFGSLA